MDPTLENSFVEKVVIKNNLAQAAQLDAAKGVCAKSPGKSLLSTLKEMNVVGDEQVTQITKLFERYKLTQTGSQSSGTNIEPAAAAPVAAAPSVMRIGASMSAAVPAVQRIGPSAGGAGGAGGGPAPTVQRIGPSAGGAGVGPAPTVQKIGPAIPTIQKIGPAAGSGGPAIGGAGGGGGGVQKIGPAVPAGQPLSSKGNSNAVLTIRRGDGSQPAPAGAGMATAQTAPAPAAAPNVAAPAPRISISNTGSPPSAMLKAVGAPAIQRIGAAAQDAPPMPKDVAQFSHVHHYLEYARTMGASDIHLNTGAPPMMRKYGKLITLNRPPLTIQETEKLLLSMLNKAQRETMDAKQSVEFCYSIKDVGRYRSCILRQRIGWDGAFRVINSEVPAFDELGLPPELRRLTEFHQGLVLVTGPNGCGKSTTMAAMIRLINENREEHIISIEDPVEYVHDPKKCQVNQREVGANTKSFANALRAALREDPDIIMIGELRDEETTSLAITAAETGHLVFGTLHTTSAARTIDRVLDVFSPEEQGQIRSMISESIRGIICQQLIPRKDGNGRALALEILFNTPAVANLIRERKLHQLPSAMQTGRKLGMLLLDDSLMNLLKAGKIDGADAYFGAENKATFAQWAPKAT